MTQDAAGPGDASAEWAARYAVVQRLADIDNLVRNASVYPRWIDDTHTFWYDHRTPDGVEYRLLDAEKGDDRMAVSHRELVDSISRHVGQALPAERVILRDLDLALDPVRATFDYAGHAWAYRVADGALEDRGTSVRAAWTVSPDGRRAVSIRDWNLWIHDLETGADRQATTDGEEFNAYGLGASTMRSVYAKYGLRAAPDGIWSPDSRWFFSLQTDEREVLALPAMTFVPKKGLRPTVHPNRTSAPGDPNVTEFRMFVLDPDTGRQLEPAHGRLPSTRMNDTPFAAEMAWWAADGRTVYFVHLERGERTAHVVAFDVVTGRARTVFTETSDAALELSVSLYDPALIIPLVESNELIWYSERTGRGHLYLYDLATGDVKRPLTRGEWQVRELLRVDPVRREAWFLAGGIAPDEDPYVRKVCVTSLDDGEVRVVSGEPGDHRVWRPRSWDFAVLSRTTGTDIARISGCSPDGEYVVETVGDVDRLPRSILRRRTGEAVCVVAEAEDIGLPAGWQWPERIRAVAADGVTDIHGLLFRPADYDPAKQYPLIDLAYGGVQESFVPKSAFVDYPTTCTYVEAAGYAALGAFCLVLDGRGTAMRERAFRLAANAPADTAGLDDHAATIEGLAREYPIDPGRVGITGFSGGGTMAAMAALRRGDVFSVAVAASGGYDSRLFFHGAVERYSGPYDADRYERMAVKSYAAGLTGRLLLIHGLEDFGVHPAGLFQLIQALEDENKDIDLVILPTTRHEVTGYGMRRRLDYFVTHLFGSPPPPPVRMLDTRAIVLERERANAEVVAGLTKGNPWA